MLLIESEIWIVDAGSGRFWNIRQGQTLMYQVQSTDRTLPLQCWNELRGRAFRAERPLPTVTVFDVTTIMRRTNYSKIGKQDFFELYFIESRKI